MKRIPISGPWITKREIEYVTDAVSNAWYSDANLYNHRFEKAFAEYVGRKHALALPSCTSALHLSLLALGIGPGDEVVVPDVTWIASSAPISYVGATPRFADIDRDTWCISPKSLASVMNERTRAVIVVDLYGSMPDMAAIEAIVAAYPRASLIEDAAEAVGSELCGQKAGSFGAFSTFSFHGSKTLTTGEGGMLLTDDDALARRAAILRDHGREPSETKMFWNAEVGQKYKMSSMQAALGLAQLERIDELVERKREVFAHYKRRLAGVAGVRLNAEPTGVKNSFWMVTLVLEPSGGLEKEALMERLASRGIDSRPFFYPLSSIPAYATEPDSVRARTANEISYDVAPYAINLPSSPTLTSDDIDRVADAVIAILNEHHT